MEAFIKYLSDEGKIDDTVPPEIEGVYVGAYTTASSMNTNLMESI